MNHPPLCPKTSESFEVRDGAIMYSFGFGEYTLHSEIADDCRFIARYQACAWMDRAEKWHDLFERCDDDARDERMLVEVFVCIENGRAWREWEKSHD